MNEQDAHKQRVAQIEAVLPDLLRRKFGRSCLYIGATPWRFQLGKELYDAGHNLTLLEIDPDNAYYYQGHPWLDDVIRDDVRNLPVTRRWDAVVWWHGPEHIEKADLQPTLNKLESVADLVVLAAPWGTNEQPMVEGNAHQEHKSHLQPSDFEKLGYHTITCGIENDLSTWPHILAWKVAEPERVIYTAIFGNYDQLLPVDYPGRFVVFSDKSLNVKGWECITVKRRFDDSRLEARMYKLLAHQWFPDIESSLWIDGNCELLVNPDDLFVYLDDADIALPIHPSSKTLEDEAAFIVQLGKADRQSVYQQLARYDSSLPVGATTWLLRRHHRLMQCLNDMWWSELSTHTLRDQMSLPHCLDWLDITPNFINVDLYNNNLVKVHAHLSTVDKGQ